MLVYNTVENGSMWLKNTLRESKLNIILPLKHKSEQLDNIFAQPK